MPAAFRSLFTLLVCCLFAPACNEVEMGAPLPAASVCDSEQQPCTYSHDFGRTEVAAGEERTAHCYSFKLDNPTDLWVNTVEVVNDGAFHHSNWFFVPEYKFVTPDPSVPCEEIDFTELGAGAWGGVLFAQSTQSRSETQKFAATAAVRVPAYSRIITPTSLAPQARWGAHRLTGGRCLCQRPSAERLDARAALASAMYRLRRPLRSASGVGTAR